MVITYLREKGYLLKGKQTIISTDQIASELDIHDNMITTLTELLKEKGQINQEEQKKRMQKKLHS